MRRAVWKIKGCFVTIIMFSGLLNSPGSLLEKKNKKIILNLDVDLDQMFDLKQRNTNSLLKNQDEGDVQRRANSPAA